jgi:hypothetical protein
VHACSSIPRESESLGAPENMSQLDACLVNHPESAIGLFNLQPFCHDGPLTLETSQMAPAR